MSKQTELDEILKDLADGEAAEEAWVDARQALLDWHNKQVIEKLEELEYHDMSLKGNKAILKQINKLKEQTNE